MPRIPAANTMDDGNAFRRLARARPDFPPGGTIGSRQAFEFQAGVDVGQFAISQRWNVPAVIQPGAHGNDNRTHLSFQNLFSLVESNGLRNGTGFQAKLARLSLAANAR